MGYPLAALAVKPPQQTDPLEQYGRALQIRQLMQNAPIQQQAMQQENQLRGLQIQQQQAMNTAWAGAFKDDGSIDAEAVTKKLAEGGAGSAVPAVSKALNDLAEQRAKLQEYKDKHAEAENNYMGSMGAALQAGTPSDLLFEQANRDGYGQAVQQAQAALQKGMTPGQLGAALVAHSAKQQEAQAAMIRAKNTGMSEAALAAKAAQGDETAQAALAELQKNKVDTASKEAKARIDQQFSPEVTKARAAQAGAEAAARVPAEVSARVQGEVGAQRALQNLQASNPATAAIAGVSAHLQATVLDKASKIEDDHDKAVQASNNMEEFIREARGGNKEAVRIIPLQGALEIVTAQGIHRINRTEVEQYGSAGDLYDKIAGKVGGILTGKNIPDSVLNDMDTMQKTIGRSADTLRSNRLQSINHTYGSNFQPKATPQTSGVIYARDPSGKLHQAPAGTPLPPGWKQEQR